VKEIEVQIVNRLGLHARAAARLVHTASRYRARITVRRGRSRVDGKSILGLLTLAAARGTKLWIRGDGADADAALDELARLVEGRFGEDE
jgi:phosphocarrier protein HPr